MNTAWTIAAAAAAVGLAGTVRTRILALGVPAGHPPRLACPGCESSVIPSGRMDALGWSLLTGRCRTCHARSVPPRGTVEVVLAVAAGVLVHTSAAPVGAPVLVCLAAAGVTLAFVEAAVRCPAGRFTAAAARATSVQHGPQAAVTATPEAAGVDLAGGDITCADLSVVTDLSRRGGSVSVTVGCSVCIASLACMSGIQGSFTARATCTAPIGTFRHIPLGAAGDRRPSGVPA
ncbi:prepilin peptidase [Micromonospora sp. HUAS YX12]|uniref:Prepilin peptidase n=1 Tax=Micromonospora sp. HUAS YX12 TaxID=3156396 RepID=A0AAU7QX11_9ACTN